MNQSNSNHSERTHTNATDTHTVLSTVSLPTLDHLKANDSIQKALAERLSAIQHLNLTGMSQKIKSQCGGVEVFVKKKVKWPHEYVLASSNKERVTYDQLTMGQWMVGFCRAMREEKDQNSKNSMLDYLIALLDDSNDFSWASVSWVRHAHAQRHAFNDQDAGKTSSKHTQSKSMVCQYYNSGTCSQQNTHETKGVLYKHVCSFLFYKEWNKFPTY